MRCNVSVDCGLDWMRSWMSELCPVNGSKWFCNSLEKALSVRKVNFYTHWVKFNALLSTCWPPVALVLAGHFHYQLFIQLLHFLALNLHMPQRTHCVMKFSCYVQLLSTCILITNLEPVYMNLHYKIFDTFSLFMFFCKCSSMQSNGDQG